MGRGHLHVICLVTGVIYILWPRKPLQCQKSLAVFKYWENGSWSIVIKSILKIGLLLWFHESKGKKEIKSFILFFFLICRLAGAISAAWLPRCLFITRFLAGREREREREKKNMLSFHWSAESKYTTKKAELKSREKKGMDSCFSQGHVNCLSKDLNPTCRFHWHLWSCRFLLFVMSLINELINLNTSTWQCDIR